MDKDRKDFIKVALTVILFVSIILLCFMMIGCVTAYMPPRFNSYADAIAGNNMAEGKIGIDDARQIARLKEDEIYLEERNWNLKYEKELEKAIGNPEDRLTDSGIPGEIHNRSWIPGVTFYFVGPLQREEAAYLVSKGMSIQNLEAWVMLNKRSTKTFTVNLNNSITAELSGGTYVCYFLDGSHQLDRPRIIGVNPKKKYFFGNYVNWGAAYVR